MTGRTIVVNPLGAALLHYRRELVSVLRASGQSTEVVEFLEPSAGDVSRFRWVLKYLHTLRVIRFRRSGADRAARVVITWPVLGYLDLLLLTFLLPNAWLTVHDPVPLVRSVGYGSFARAMARLLRSRAKVVVLSDAAADEVRKALPRAALKTLPHPMIEPVPAPARPAQLNIRVLGQYKEDRDLELLRQLATVTTDAMFSISGRGWPRVDGWEVDDRFVPEDELDNLIKTASVVLIPYRRFFQSGIAVRCLELGTPVVGPRHSSLRELLRRNPALLADTEPEDWTRAVESALQLSSDEMARIGAAEYKNSVSGWMDLPLNSKATRRSHS